MWITNHLWKSWAHFLNFLNVFDAIIHIFLRVLVIFLCASHMTFWVKFLGCWKNTIMKDFRYIQKQLPIQVDLISSWVLEIFFPKNVTQNATIVIFLFLFLFRPHILYFKSYFVSSLLLCRRLVQLDRLILIKSVGFRQQNILFCYKVYPCNNQFEVS